MYGGRIAFTLLLLLLTALVGVGALKCYQCDSHTQPGCHPLDKNLIQPTECPTGTRSCIILKQDAQFRIGRGDKPEPQVRYARECSTQEAKTAYSCIDRAGTGSNTKNKYCICSADGCNSASRNAIFGAGLIALLLHLLSYTF